MIKSKLLILSICILSFLISCKEQTSSPDNGASVYLPLSTGRYWIYNKYLTWGDSRPDSLVGSDTLVVNSKIKLNDTTGYLLIMNPGSASRDSFFFSADKNGIYRYSTPNTDTIYKDIKSWFKIGHNSQLIWSLFSDFYYTDYPFEGDTYNSELNIIIGCTYLYVNQITIGTKNYNTRAYQYRSDKKFGFSKKFDGYTDTAFVQITDLRSEDFYFSENIGIVKWVKNPYSLQIKSLKYSPYTTPTEIQYAGIKRELIKYGVK